MHILWIRAVVRIPHDRAVTIEKYSRLPRQPFPKLFRSSSGESVAVPSLPTTTALAWLAISAASNGVAPLHKRERKQRDGSIACSRNVENLTCLRWNVMRFLAVLEKHHSVLAQGDK